VAVATKARARAKAKTKATDARAELADIEERLQPRLARSWAISRLNEMFAAGSPPDPAPDGFHRGRAITGSIWGPLDAAGRRLAGVYMPWLGKAFDASAETGINVLTRSARAPMKVLWPSYQPEKEDGERIEAFPFRTRIAPGELDPGVSVLKIDYDFDANPSFVIRRILDELVQVDPGFYLGKVLVRTKSGYRLAGFFSLENP
jgi:hypothetical protein